MKYEPGDIIAHQDNVTVYRVKKRYTNPDDDSDEGLRGRREMREKAEELQERLNPGEETPMEFRNQGRLDALLWVARWRDDL